MIVTAVRVSAQRSTKEIEVLVIAGILLTVGKIVAAILIFGIIILVHELGHMLVAKWMGVKVNEFAIGMGPQLLSFGKKETKYTIRLFPIGGFCAMEGEDADANGPSSVPSAGAGGTRPESLPVAEVPLNTAEDAQEAAEQPASADGRAFYQKKVWRRVLIVIAGAAMNLVLGFALLVVYFGACTPANAAGDRLYSTTTLARVPETASSYKTGLRGGDEILKINGKRVMTEYDLVMLLQSDEDGVFDILVNRTVDGVKQKIRLPGVTFELKTDEETGQRILIYDFIVLGVKPTVLNTLSQAAKTEYSVAIMIWRTLGDLLTGKFGLNDLAGPVGTVDAIGDAVAGVVTQPDPMDGVRNLLMMVIMITVNVGIFNLLPLPALDGGRLLFLAFEGIFRRPIPAKYESMVHFIGLLLLFGLMIIVTFSDISRMIAGG